MTVIFILRTIVSFVGKDVSSVVACVRRYDLEVNAKMPACELKTSNTRCLLFGVFYRRPDVEEAFLDEISQKSFWYRNR